MTEKTLKQPLSKGESESIEFNTTQKTRTREKILEILHTDPNMTREELANVLGKSPNTIKEHIAKLKADGRLERIGSDRHGYWRVLNKKSHKT